MKKIIALALALIMVLSMGVVALAADYSNAKFDEDYAAANTDFGAVETAPGEKIYLLNDQTGAVKRDLKVSYDFTSSKYGFNGASMIESIAWVKDAKASAAAEEPLYDLVITLKESLTSTTAKNIAGLVTLTSKTEKEIDPETGKEVAAKYYFLVAGEVANEVAYIAGAKKAADAETLTVDAGDGEIYDMMKNVVMFAEDGAGYVTFTDGDALTGLVKVAKDEKAQVYFADLTEDENDAIEAYLGEDYEAIVEEFKFAGTGFGADVDFTYKAWEEDPHFFYAWDGEKFVDLEGKFNDDEDVEAYEFTAAAKGIIIVTDVEIVAGAADTKNPDTGANDVVGVAAALAVVSLVAAGAVSLKK